MSNDKQAPELKMINGSAHLDGSHLLQYIERIEKLNEDAEAIASDIKEVYTEAKMSGFDKKYVKEIVKLRKLDPDQLSEQDELLRMYREAAGLL